MAESWMRRCNWRGSKPAWTKGLELAKSIAGARYLAKEKVWLIPTDAWRWFAQNAVRAGCQVSDLGHKAGHGADTPDHNHRMDLMISALTDLHPWQQRDVPKLAAEGGIVSYATGLGKTATALRAMRLDAALSRVVPSALICTPALVRSHWARELHRWWPEVGDDFAIVEEGVWAGIATSEGAPGVLIVSPETLGKIPVSERRWLVLDEGDGFRNELAKRTSAARLHRAKTAKVLILSATLVSKEPDDLYSPLDLIWPGRFGKSVWDFRRAYMNVEKVIGDKGEVYGTVARGLKPGGGEALAARLVSLICSANHDEPEVAARLPPLALTSDWLPPASPFSGEWSGAAISAWMAESADAKVRAVVEKLRGATGPVCILTHLRETAEKIGAALEAEGLPVTVTHGGAASGPRLKKVAAAVESGAHLVATMHSLGVGIDLTHFSRTILAEAYWVPRVLIQAMGRFRRLSSPDVPVVIEMLLERGSPDELMSLALRRRLEDQAALLKTGKSEDVLAAALCPMTEEEALVALRETAATGREIDPYLEGGDDDE